MKQTIIKSFATILLILMAISAKAYDFYKDGIYYNITSREDKTLEVTSLYDYASIYSGDVIIPSCIEIGNDKYFVTSIRHHAFNNCSDLTSVTIPNTVTSIGNRAFYYCTNLTSITIPKNVSRIEECTFYYCTNLTSVTILCDGIISIDCEAFYGCNSIKEINIYSVVAPGCDWDSFASSYWDATLYVPDHDNAIENYKNASPWDNFRNIVAKNFSNTDTKINVSGISLNTTSKSMATGETLLLTATVSPNDASDKSVTWSSDNTSVATVSNTGLVTALAAGTAKITCSANDGSGKTATCTITVQKKSESLTVTTSSAGYSTFYSSESAYKLPSRMSARVVSGCSNNKLTYKTIADGSAGGVIPKGTAVMLVYDSKSASTFTLTPSESTVEYTGTNYLHGSDKSTTVYASGSNYYYKLTYGEGADSNVFGWYWGASGGAAFSIDGHKAWLALPKSSATRSSFDIDDVTGIDDVDADEGDGIYYDLQGRRIGGRPEAQGVYIVNGKKVLIKK